jgi:hypothetical protein
VSLISLLMRKFSKVSIESKKRFACKERFMFGNFCVWNLHSDYSSGFLVQSEEFFKAHFVLNVFCS